MGESRLTISGRKGSRSVPLSARGVLIGRDPSNGVVLDSGRVSRRHARLFQDPFGRWIVEDLKSRHGIRIAGQPVTAQAVLPGEKIVIGPFTLSIAEALDRQIEADPSVATSTTILQDDASSQIVESEPDIAQPLHHDRLRHLDQLAERLAEMVSPSELYPEVCRSVAGIPGSVVIVLRLPHSSRPLPTSPMVLACYSAIDLKAGPGEVPTNLHLSRRVLEAVRTTGKAILASSLRSSDAQVTLTIIDENRPRAVACAPITEMGETTDVLYVDSPLGKAPNEILHFVRVVARQTSLARKNLLSAEARAEHRSIERQLAMAREIQARLTPQTLACPQGVDVALSYQPAMWVGGDYCDVWTLPDGRLTFAIGDVSGKGLPAAIVMANLQAALRTTMSFCADPAEAMGHVHRHLGESLPMGRFVSLFLGLLDPRNGELEYVNAGHVPPLIVHAEEGVATLDQVLNSLLGPGLLKDPFVSSSRKLSPDSCVVVVTDGVTEAMSPQQEQFGVQGLQMLLETTVVHSAQHVVQSITTAAEQFRQFLPQQDDTTVLALLYRG